MSKCVFYDRRKNRVGFVLVLAMLLLAQTPHGSSAAVTLAPTKPHQQPQPTPTSCAVSTGGIGPTTICSSIDLDIRVDPEKKFVSGKNTIRFKMLKDDTRIQLDLYDNLKIDKILFRGQRSGQVEVRSQRSER